jgi:ubiquinone/menaquinone biosynthesis C-methylase UbiE
VGSSEGYVHGYASEEQERLVQQAEHWRDDLILDGTSLAPGTRLLEVGCGVGAVLKVLGEAFPGVSLTGVDVEERQIASAREYLGDHGIEADLRQGDALALPFEDESFDQVWMMWFVEHLADPLGALCEARRVLVPGGALTAIEVDYNTVWSRPESEGFQALFAAVARAMDAGGRSDAGTHLAAWLVEAGFTWVDPGRRKLDHRGPALARQAPYVADVIEATLPSLASDGDAALLRSGLAHLRSLPEQPGAAIGWDVFKATARR